MPSNVSGMVPLARSGLSSEPVFTTLGLTYFPRPSLAYDVVVVVGLNEEAPDFQLVFGFTQNLGRLGRVSRR